MRQLEVELVRLERARVAAALGYGKEPEFEAWERIIRWAEGKYDLAGSDTRSFGFNNPDPSAGSPDYGYEVWLTVGDQAAGGEGARNRDIGDEEITFKEMPGGLYAAARIQGVQHIHETWQQLVVWRQANRYRPAHHQWLEELVSSPRVPPEDLEFILYLPIKKPLD